MKVGNFLKVDSFNRILHYFCWLKKVILTKRKENRFLKLLMVAILTIVFSIGFNFYRVFLHSSSRVFDKNSDYYALKVSGVIASHDYKVFPSRKQLISDPENNILSKFAFVPAPDTNPGISGLMNHQKTDHICLTNGKYLYSQYSQNISIGQDESFQARICTFLI